MKATMLPVLATADPGPARIIYGNLRHELDLSSGPVGNSRISSAVHFPA